MKKILAGLFLILLVFIISGCSKESIDDKKIDENHNKMEYYTKIDNFNCPELNENTKEIVGNDVTGYYFVDKDGFLYEFSVNKIFSSTNTNCSKIDTNGKYMAGFSGSSAYDKNDYEYSLDDINGERGDPSIRRQKSREYFIRKSFPDSSLQLFLINIFGIIVEDNKLYEAKFDLGGGSTNKEEINFDNSEEIINIYEMNYSSEGFFVETEHSYFMCEKEIVNSQKCEMYADIECKKEFVCNQINDFDNFKVENFLGDIVILDDGSVYKHKDFWVE